MWPNTSAPRLVSRILATFLTLVLHLSFAISAISTLHVASPDGRGGGLPDAVVDSSAMLAASSRMVLFSWSREAWISCDTSVISAAGIANRLSDSMLRTSLRRKGGNNTSATMSSWLESSSSMLPSMLLSAIVLARDAISISCSQMPTCCTVQTLGFCGKHPVPARPGPSAATSVRLSEASLEAAAPIWDEHAAMPCLGAL
eukprot:CAMPEP_0179414292 /NCGR_PEP_ID=MMETSP0799-20121207/5582_1 /TAXON_ID=46947 /ORGANISM="Geminigera cryophila, Strain CCMP2564" /LENGTH=200 /DNA_ID=CAMNT_0021186877 /DNA_START=296 /DNA_END=899 /DNA_ORIENTATION=+